MRTFFPRRPRLRNEVRAFTLVEVAVTLALLLIVLVTLVEFMSNVDRVWKSAAVDPFAEAGSAFESVAHHLSGATLETYQDYADITGAFCTASSPSTFAPDHLARRSDLAFVCGASGGTNGWLASSGRVAAGDGVFFLAPQGYTQTEVNQGMDHLLDALGYFVEFSDESNVPAFLLPITHRWRWRLKQIEQPSESLGIYTLPDSPSWVQSLVQPGAPVGVLAENVIALLVLPDRAANDSGAPLSTDYHYDSRDATNPLTRNQLPTRLRLALVSIDEASAQILAAQNGTQPPSLIPAGLFVTAAQLDADLATLDASLTTRKINHRLFQREILLPAAAWSNTPSS
jgi:uncharacterized protein (TIGR02599 family)